MDKVLNVTLKDSRGGGDNIVIPIEGYNNLTFRNDIVEVTDILGNLFMFPVHNVVYMAIFVDSDRYKSCGSAVTPKYDTNQMGFVAL